MRRSSRACPTRGASAPDLVDGLAPSSYARESHDLIGISADNRRVAFVRQTIPSAPEILAADLPSRTLIPVTREAGYAAPWATRFSGNGRFVAFTSEAGDLVPGDTNGAPDAFVADLETGAITLVDRTSGGTPVEGGAETEAISYDGRYVSFSSRTHDLDPAATNGVRQVYLRDMTAGTTIAVSRRAGVAGALGDRDSSASTMTNDGRVVAFTTDARNLPHRQCSGSNIALRDVKRSTTRLIRRPVRLPGRCSMRAPALSGGKTRIAYVARGIARKRTQQVYVVRMRRHLSTDR